MKLDIILKELRKDNWLTGITFIEDNREYLQALVDKTEEQLRLCGVTQAKRPVCPDCFDRGELRNDKEEIIGICPCHY